MSGNRHVICPVCRNRGDCSDHDLCNNTGVIKWDDDMECGGCQIPAGEFPLQAYASGPPDHAVRLLCDVCYNSPLGSYAFRRSDPSNVYVMKMIADCTHIILKEIRKNK